jgi:hypothetical protein
MAGRALLSTRPAAEDPLDAFHHGGEAFSHMADQKFQPWMAIQCT